MSTSMKGKNVWWLYQARRVNTQTAANGALATVISFPVGMVAKMVQVTVTGAASADAELYVTILDEDGSTNGLLGYLTAGASRTFNLPSIGDSATTNNKLNSTGMMFGPGQTIKCYTTAALQTEALTVGVVLLLNISTIPIWDTTGSAGTPSLAASTISAALQAVAM